MIAYPIVSPVRGDRLYRIFTDKELIQTLAAQLVANQAEVHIDMMSDSPAEYASFQDAASALSTESVTESAIEYVNALLAEFSEELIAAVKTRQVAIKSVTIAGTGFTDADIEVE